MDIDKLAHEIRQIKEAFAVFSPEKIQGVLADIAKLRADVEPMLAEWRQFKERGGQHETAAPKPTTTDKPIEAGPSDSTGDQPGQPQAGDVVT